MISTIDVENCSDPRKVQARAKILERMIIAECERVKGLYIDAKDSIAQINARHGL